MKKILVVALALLVSVMVAMAAVASAASAPKKCKVTAVYGEPFSQQVTLPNGQVAQQEWLRLMPASKCGSTAVKQFSWTYIFPQVRGTAANGHDFRFRAEIQMPDPEALVEVTITVNAPGSKPGSCTFRVNDPRRLPFPRYLWGC